MPQIVLAQTQGGGRHERVAAGNGGVGRRNAGELDRLCLWHRHGTSQLYLAQFLTVFDDPGIKFTALYVGTWYNIPSHD